ncbi:response regulator [Fulvivirgaceae bacterium BMA12]|uniref:histidine kinase n=1 Tax=Agaribacillus aureus TaxID=3051825 RepID=A0ABT8KZA4_9BACT|nr:response regulator [Fulvivirgaceae bacterium BMA12]
MNTKKIFLFIVILINAVDPVFTQDRQVVDSLTQLLPETSDDSLRIEILYALAGEYYYNNREKSMEYGENILRVSRETNNKWGMRKGYNVKGSSMVAQAKYDSAITYFEQAFQISEADKVTDKESMFTLYWLGSSYVRLKKHKEGRKLILEQLSQATVLKNKNYLAKGEKGLGISYYMEGNNEMALKHYLRCDSILGDAKSIMRGDNLQNIAIIYHSLDKRNLEYKYLDKALEVYQAIGDEWGEAQISKSLGNAEKEKGNYESALQHFNKAYDYFEKGRNLVVMGQIHAGKGEVFYRMNKFEKALSNLKQAVDYLDDTDDGMGLTYAYMELGRTYLALGRYGNARQAFDQTFSSIKSGENKQARMKIHQALSEYYADLGLYDQAYDAQSRYIMVKDSVDQEKYSGDLLEMENKYQSQQKAQQIDLLEAQNQLTEESAKNQRILFFIIAVGIALLAVVFFVMYKAKLNTNRKLKQLDALKSRLYVNLAHEFRTPLTLITGPVKKRLTDDALTQDERHAMQMISRNTDQLLDLTNQLLDLSKLEEGSVTLKISKGDMGKLLHQITASYNHLATEKSIHYSISCDPLEAIYYDRQVILKSVNNLLSNAFKFTASGGIVDFRAEEVAGKVMISVANSGSKIPDDKVEKLFERFYRAENSQDGSGIGLALVKELVTLSRGTVEVQQVDRPTFIISLPVMKEAFAPQEIMAVEESVEPSNNLAANGSVQAVVDSDHGVLDTNLPLILLVEDHEEIRSFLRECLRDQYQLLEAENGKEGIELALEKVPDLIISDIMMPETDGIALLNRLKHEESTAHIPIMLLTAKVGEEHELEGLKTGADDYITKPFNPEILLTKVKNQFRLIDQFQKKYSQEIVLKPVNIPVSTKEASFLKKLQYILEEEISNGDFNIEKFCEITGMSRMQLHRKMKALTGISPHAYIRKARLNLAAELLRNNDLNIAEIGYMVGFNDPSFFAKSFKEQFGITPKEFISNPTAE